MDMNIEQPKNRADEQAGGSEEHCSRDVQPRKTGRHGGVAEQQCRDRRECPCHPLDQITIRC